MKLLFACGGTGGHINPALAVANYARSQDPSVEILFAGNPDGMEARLVKEAGYRFAPIRVKGLQRKFSLRNIGNNIMAAIYLTSSGARAKKILRGFEPDVVVGTGGYVSWPVVKAASQLGIPCALHESNAIPGVAVRMLASSVDRIYLNFEETGARLGCPEKLLRVGNPLLNTSFTMDQAEARAKLGIPDKYKYFIHIDLHSTAKASVQIGTKIPNSGRWRLNRHVSRLLPCRRATRRPYIVD